MERKKSRYKLFPTTSPPLESVVLSNQNIHFENERDVEINLLEPLLEKLGYTEKDWIRQLPLRMGRGERNYPDYAIGVDHSKKHEETAKLIFEAKFRIKNQKELKESFLQAKSYARRLNCTAMVIVAVEGLWISHSKDEFNFEKLTYFNWNEFESSEKWNLFKKLIS